MVVLRVERRPFAHPVERDQHAARASPEAERRHNGGGGLPGDAVQPVPDARGQVWNVLSGAACDHRAGNRGGRLDRGADDVAAHLPRRGLHAQHVVILEEHQEGARLGHGPSALDDQLEHAAQLGLESHRSRDRRGGL